MVVRVDINQGVERFIHQEPKPGASSKPLLFQAPVSRALKNRDSINNSVLVTVLFLTFCLFIHMFKSIPLLASGISAKLISVLLLIVIH